MKLREYLAANEIDPERDNPIDWYGNPEFIREDPDNKGNRIVYFDNNVMLIDYSPSPSCVLTVYDGTVNMYMNIETGSVDDYDGWWYIDEETQREVNAVDRGEVVMVRLEAGEWVAI